MPEIRIERAAKKDLKRIGPGPERDRIVAGLRRPAEDVPNLDIKTIVGATPGWFRLRIGEDRICYYRARVAGSRRPSDDLCRRANRASRGVRRRSRVTT